MLSSGAIERTTYKMSRIEAPELIRFMFEESRLVFASSEKKGKQKKTKLILRVEQIVKILRFRKRRGGR